MLQSEGQSAGVADPLLVPAGAVLTPIVDHLPPLFVLVDEVPDQGGLPRQLEPPLFEACIGATPDFESYFPQLSNRMLKEARNLELRCVVVLLGAEIAPPFCESIVSNYGHDLVTPPLMRWRADKIDLPE